MVAKAVNSDRFFQADRFKNQNSYKKKTASYSSEEKPIGPCNLDRFLESTMPFVPPRYHPKSSEWGDSETEIEPFFTLSDLWESFSEWSAYGLGVPVILNGCESMVQYYVPYLSAIQLFSESYSPCSEFRGGLDSDGYSYRDTSSDISSDNEQEKLANYMLDNLLLRDNDNLPFQDGLFTSPPLFEFFEHEPPHIREPLYEKIGTLAMDFPLLRTLKSCDLSPGSWISVAWYPIYRIPTGYTLRDIETCFLTYHCLSTPTNGVGSEFRPTLRYNKEEGPVISLPTFGLANYKFRPNIWTPHRSEKQTAWSLIQSADNWIQTIDVLQPDYQFFSSRLPSRR